jgi:hypothetical protein
VEAYDEHSQRGASAAQPAEPGDAAAQGAGRSAIRSA